MLCFCSISNQKSFRRSDVAGTPTSSCFFSKQQWHLQKEARQGKNWWRPWVVQHSIPNTASCEVVKWPGLQIHLHYQPKGCTVFHQNHSNYDTHQMVVEYGDQMWWPSHFVGNLKVWSSPMIFQQKTVEMWPSLQCFRLTKDIHLYIKQTVSGNTSESKRCSSRTYLFIHPKEKSKLTLEKQRAQDAIDVLLLWLSAASFHMRNVEFQSVAHSTRTKTSLWVSSYFATLKNISPYFPLGTIEESSQPIPKKKMELKGKKNFLSVW